MCYNKHEDKGRKTLQTRKGKSMKTLFYFQKKDHIGFEAGIGSYVQFDNPNGWGRKIQGSMHMDYEKVGDGRLWVMQRAAVLKAEYSNRDRIQNRLYNEADVLEDGEVVEIMIVDTNGSEYKLVSKKQYRFKVLGDYSDCAIFEEIEQEG